MRRISASLVAGAAAALSLFVMACGERASSPTAPARASLSSIAAAACALDAAGIYAQIAAVFPAGNDRTAAEARFDNIDKLLQRESPADSATAQEHALTLIEFTIRKFRDGKLIEGTTVDEVGLLVNALLCYSGLPANIDPNALGPDGAIALISPTTDTTLTTGTLWAGADFDAGSVSQTVLVTIYRVPPAGETLATNLDTYPLYYEFSVSPATEFAEPILVGVCQPEDLVLPTEVSARLRLAHNVGPAGDRQLEILDFQPAPFLDCTGATEFAAGPVRSGLRALASALLPHPLMAAGSGLGGTVRTFSPFAAVDPVVYQEALTSTDQRHPIGDDVPEAPAVSLHTRLGTPMPGLNVQFAVTAGGGLLNGGTDPVDVLTDAQGAAALTSWTLGMTPGVNTVEATGESPHAGATVSPNPRVFTATATPPTQLTFEVQPSASTAGSPIAPAMTVAVRDEDGTLVRVSTASVTLDIASGPTGAVAGGTLTSAAAGGIATFGNVILTKAGAYTLQASSSGLQPATSDPFQVQPAAADTVFETSATDQTADEGASVADPPAVRVTDAYGNGVQGVVVTFQVASGGGSVSGGTQTTDAGGNARVGAWTIAAGSNTLYATAGSLKGSPVVFRATGRSLLETLVSCEPGQGGGDDLSRGFYLPSNFKITRLRQVSLYMSSNDPASTPTPYTIALVARSGGFNGTVVGRSEQTLYFRGNASQNLPVNFVFADPAVPSNTPLTFSFEIVSRGGTGTVTFNTGTCGLGDSRCRSGCPVIETQDTSGDLSTFRRRGCGITVTGWKR